MSDYCRVCGYGTAGEFMRDVQSILTVFTVRSHIDGCFDVCCPAQAVYCASWQPCRLPDYPTGIPAPVRAPEN